MAILEVNNLSHSFVENVLYRNSSFEIYNGEHIGIVGRNGTGKTTLLSSLVGMITPDTGDIRWQKDLKIGYLDQHAVIDQEKTISEYLHTAFSDLYEIETELNNIYSCMDQVEESELQKASDYQSLLVNRGFYEIDSTILKVSDGLGITSLGMDSQICTLSGGQRAKVILAKLLLENPDVLLLDEPTNYLDKEHVEWITNFLKVFNGTFLVISHNFDFLDQISNCILDIDFQDINKYHGNFTKFLKIKNLKRESYEREYKAQQREIKKQEEYIAKNRVRASTARLAQSRMKKLEKMERLTPPNSVSKPNFKLQSTTIGLTKALKVHSLEIGYTKVLLPQINFDVKSGEKVVITGFNGVGKSTLLKTLLGVIPAISGQFKFADYVKIGYFEQDLKWKDKMFTPTQIVSDAFPNLSQKEVRKKLARCGITVKNALQSIGTLSGGEQAKVKLCILVNTESNFLILDEPTNHLDENCKDVLKEELVKWTGNLILVSHEESFYSSIADKVISL